ncbi:MAG: imidazole glycerol phosphate synthase subunit HisH [Clostridia bacterium]|nr:imidazole glycerol phosphate synthase subunit HisH [Clostridia bacterium]
MIAIIDYGAGNLKSVEKAFLHLGCDVMVTGDKAEIEAADKVILPGVGAFGHCVEALHRAGMEEVVHLVAQRGTPLLGICVGLQLMFEESEESPGAKGLGLFKGKIVKIPPADGLKIPQMGWNCLTVNEKSRLLKGIPNDTFVYFVHSFYPKLDNPADSIARSTYGIPFDVAVERGNVFATQFHPEKSGEWGLHILENFAKL